MMVYGGGMSRLEERELENRERWMTVHVTQLDSTYEFGHIPEDGGFAVYVSEPEGRFRIQGGDVRHFAIRSIQDVNAVYALQKYGTYELAGPAMIAERSIFPVVDEAYYSILILTFHPSRSDTVTVELVTSSPNGFTNAAAAQ